MLDTAKGLPQSVLEGRRRPIGSQQSAGFHWMPLATARQPSSMLAARPLSSGILAGNFPFAEQPPWRTCLPYAIRSETATVDGTCDRFTFSFESWIEVLLVV